tara:strand:- start:165 stop:299 length:135 start_codon:yes stop_codon:yes gene_type:complete
MPTVEVPPVAIVVGLTMLVTAAPMAEDEEAGNVNFKIERISTLR